MRKEFEFTIKNHHVKIVNTWSRGAKLYVDGDFKDQDTSFFAFGKTCLLSENLGEHGVLEIYPYSGLISVEMNAYLVNENQKKHVFSSTQRLSLTEQRLAK